MPCASPGNGPLCSTCPSSTYSAADENSPRGCRAAASASSSAPRSGRILKGSARLCIADVRRRRRRRPASPATAAARRGTPPRKIARGGPKITNRRGAQPPGTPSRSVLVRARSCAATPRAVARDDERQYALRASKRARRGVRARRISAGNRLLGGPQVEPQQRRPHLPT